MDDGACEFESHRRHLIGLAYRMLGVHADAQDVVQETYVRWRDVDRATIHNVRAWLVTVCSRLALNVLESARVRRESYVGLWLPEPFAESPDSPPDAQAEVDESISIALLHALERLSPAERAAFLLHDVFDHDFDEIAGILGRSAAACRQLASRARAHVRTARPRFAASAREHRRVLEAFLSAARDGRGEDLRAVLADGVELHADGGGRVETAPAGLSGAAPICAFVLGVWSRLRAQRVSTEWVAVRLNGLPAMAVFEGGTLTTVVSAVVVAGRIVRLFVQRNPEKLAALARVVRPAAGTAAQ